jgi:hypothetical protein
MAKIFWQKQIDVTRVVVIKGQRNRLQALMHRFLVIFATLQFVVGTAMAQPIPESPASKDNLLSLDQT